MVRVGVPACLPASSCGRTSDDEDARSVMAAFARSFPPLAANFTFTLTSTHPPLRLKQQALLSSSVRATTMRPSFSLWRTCSCTVAPRIPSAFPAAHIPASAKRLLHTPRTSPVIRPSPTLSQLRKPRAVRFDSTSAAPPSSASTKAPESRLDREQVPSYELTFTCNVCKTRSSHRLSKQGYHHGTILISCPDCKNRHLISDHLKVLQHMACSAKKQRLMRCRYFQTSPSPSKTSCEKRAA